MSLRILYGAPHSGKSESIYEYLIRESEAHPERTYIMLVPEQASLTVQEELVRRHPRHALFRIDILTFQRLAYRVFRETQVETKDLVDDEGKMLFLQLAVSRNRDRLTELKSGARKIGTLQALKSILSEFAEYNITPEILGEKAALVEHNERLKHKLEDLKVLYRDFLLLVHERFDLMEEQMSVLADVISRWEKAGDITIAMDGFTGFTPPQYLVVEKLLRHCREVIFGVTVGTAYTHEDSREPDGLFYMADHAMEKVKELAIRAGIPIREEEISTPAGRRPEALEFLEKELFRQSPAVYRKETDALRIVRARTAREEISFVIREILKGVRSGLRYRDMAIVSGNPDDYREELEERLREAGIPYFFDANKKLDHSPLIRFLGDAFRVCQTNLSFDSVFSFLKNPIVVQSHGEVSSYDRISEVENFALARGFRSRSGYAKVWEGSYRGFFDERLPFINETKDAVITPLIEFYDFMVKGKPSVAKRIEATRTLIRRYEAETGLKKLAVALERETGDPVEREYEAVVNYVTEYLDRAETVIGAMDLSAEEFEDMIMAGLNQAVQGHVPPTKDRLIVGNLTRTRLGAIKKLYVIGANEGKLPVWQANGGLLNEQDREALKRLELQLSESAEENLLNSRYYLYLLMNVPTEALVLVYSLSENDGNGKFPAPIVGSIQGKFPAVKTENAVNGPFEEIYSANSGLLSLAGALRDQRIGRKGPVKEETDGQIRALYQWFRSTGAYEEALRQIEEGLFYQYQREVLPKTLAKTLFGEVIRGSVSRLEQFAECPYRHFLNYGLEIHPRTVYRLAASDIGSIAHESIELFFQLLKEERKNWRDLSGEDQEKLIEKSVDAVVQGYGNEIFKDSAKNSFLSVRIRRIMVRTLWALSKQWAAGGFTETESEFKFHSADYPELLEMPLKEGLRLSLSGRVDRIDLARDSGKIFVRVIDYKTGTRALNYTKIYHGIQLQLLLYMRVAMEREMKRNAKADVVPAGIYYYTVQDPFVEPAKDAEVEQEILRELRMNGITNADPDAIRKVDALAEESGESEVVYGLKWKTSGEFFKNAKVAEGAELKELGDYSVKKAEALSNEIAAGVIEAAPYSFQGESACRFCEYRSICGQDRRLHAFREKGLEPKELADLLGGAR